MGKKAKRQPRSGKVCSRTDALGRYVLEVYAGGRWEHIGQVTSKSAAREQKRHIQGLFDNIIREARETTDA